MINMIKNTIILGNAKSILTKFGYVNGSISLNIDPGTL